MIPELGQFCLVLALCLAVAQALIPLIGSYRSNDAWMAVARSTATGQFVFLLLGFCALTYSFIVSDFSLVYVTQHSNTQLPLPYRISAVWGAHEGSLLLWVLILSGWGFAVAIKSRSLPIEMLARVLSVMAMISVGFLVFMLATSNPFDRMFPAAMEGNDLNPLLQDPGLVIHPPMLYMGYVGFSVAFAFAIAALLGGKLDSAWARWSRPWANIAWVFLTIGIGLGSWWAYHELGWGGWWFWDPVENASFMPWLVGTALIHSLAVTEKRASFKSWTVLLSILAFSLSLLGTFLVRSGVLVSVHSFASDPARGVYILGFLFVVVGASLALYAWRAPKLLSIGRFHTISRETMLLINNMFLVVVMLTILFGTLYPLFVDAFNLPKLSVGKPYFDLVFVPLTLPILFLVSLGPFAKWRNASLREIIVPLLPLLMVAVVLGVVLPLTIYQSLSVMTAIGVVLAIWAMLTSLYGLHKVARNRKKGYLAALFSAPRGYWGMSLAHFGLGVFVVGVVLTSAYSDEREVGVNIGQPVDLAGYQYTLESVTDVQGPNYQALRGHVRVTHNSEFITDLYPEKRIYTVQRSPMTEAAVDEHFFRDLYVALGDSLDNNTWGLRVYYRPMVQWLWLGPLIMSLGGLLAATDKRYRVRSTHQSIASVSPPSTTTSPSMVS